MPYKGAAPALQDVMGGQGVSVVGNSAAEFAAFIRAERERWGKVVRGAGIRAD